jgi:hypothetical protein
MNMKDIKLVGGKNSIASLTYKKVKLGLEAWLKQ